MFMLSLQAYDEVHLRLPTFQWEHASLFMANSWKIDVCACGFHPIWIIYNSPDLMLMMFQVSSSCVQVKFPNLERRHLAPAMKRVAASISLPEATT